MVSALFRSPLPSPTALGLVLAFSLLTAACGDALADDTSEVLVGVSAQQDDDRTLEEKVDTDGDGEMSDEELASIDTARCAVHMLTGEYDWTATPEASRATAERIPGATFAPMAGLGHFPMCEDPERFLAALLPVLEKVRAAGS